MLIEKWGTISARLSRLNVVVEVEGEVVGVGGLGGWDGLVWTSQSRAKGKGRAKEGRYYWLGMRELCLIQRCEVKDMRSRLWGW